jgi:hypothetical protein
LQPGFPTNIASGKGPCETFKKEHPIIVSLLNMEISNEQLKQFLSKSGVYVSDEALSIGREFTYSSALKRTVVVLFVDSYFPATVRATLTAVCEIADEWVWVDRFGEDTGIKYSTNERPDLINKLVETWPQLHCIQDDISLVSGDGKALLLFNHHILENGMPIFFSDIEKAGLLLSRLNEIGAEFEFYSKGG